MVAIMDVISTLGFEPGEDHRFDSSTIRRQDNFLPASALTSKSFCPQLTRVS